MAVSVAAVMRHVRNFFEGEAVDGCFLISGGVLSGPDGAVIDAPYVAIEGSRYHDGVTKCFDGSLEQSPVDEEFTGRVWPLYPPADFLSLCKRISDYDDKRPPSDLQSERFGNYSYTRSTGYMGKPVDVYTVFGAQLAAYRRMYTEVRG
ncbi:MAG: hypothetical protein IKK34_07090 [Clostridia bacterium]|nr:hypothetical protein [Clostridia bacterium]